MPTRNVIPFLLLLALHAPAEEVAPAAPTPSLTRPPLEAPGFSTPPTSWLGVDLARPDHTLVAHLPELPVGVGFVVKTVHHGGPANAAGLQETDLIWKLDDQLLINEAQLTTLLRLFKPGEEVTLAIFRNGERVQVPLTLGKNPGPAPALASQTAEEAIILNERGPMRVVNPFQREAFITADDGSAVVRKQGDDYWLTITDTNGEVIHNASFNRGATGTCQIDDSIPTHWKRRAYALRRGLDHAINGNVAPPRTPRPRVVPSTTQR